MKRIFALGLGFALLTRFLSAAPLTIQNETLRVTYDDASGEFSIAHIPSGKVFVSSLRLPISGKASVDTAFDHGHIITVENASGSAGILVFPGMPFALLSETLKNVGGQEQILNKVPIVSFTPQLDQPAAKLMVRGTGGLHSPEEYASGAYQWLEWFTGKITRHPYYHPEGSYEWLAVADSQSRNGMVAGFITEDHATGVLTPNYTDSKLTVDVRTEFGRLLLEPGKTEGTETLAIGYFDDVRLGLEKWADEVAHTNSVKLPPQPAGYCTWYAEMHGKSSDEKNLAVLADFIRTNLEPFGMNFVQIDDGWQLGDSHKNGPNKNFTDSNPKGPYPSGMKTTVDHLKADGLAAGLWFTPFAGSYNDAWFADKQALFVKDKDGKPYDTSWGGTCLDMTNPAAQAYVRGIVSNVVHNWGFTYLKLDAFYTGLGVRQIYVNTDYHEDNLGDAVFSDPTKTNLEVFRSGVKLVRETAGPGVFLLGCNTAQNMRTYGGSFGLVDAMRIGPDNTGEWPFWRDTSPLSGSRNYFLNGRVWYNDPDPNYVRSPFTLDEARTAASWTSISGELYTNGDWIPDLPPERLDIIKRTVAPHGKTARPVDFLENDPPRVWQVIDDKGSTRRDVVALFNWEDKELKIDVPLAKLDLPKADRYAAFDFWANAFLPDIQGTLSMTLPPHACHIIAIRPMEDHPFVLSTSLHVTQGMTDLLEEHWDAASHTLSGKSRVVGGDPYEMRLVTPDPAQHWKIFQAGLDDFHSPNGVTIITSTDKDHRAKFTAARDGVVSWLFVF